MKPDSKILDDLARVAGGAVNVFSGLQQQIRDDIKSRIDDMATKMDLVPRDDLDRALAQISALRSDVKALEKRVDALSGKKPAAATPKKKAAPAKKPAKKKAK